MPEARHSAKFLLQEEQIARFFVRGSQQFERNVLVMDAIPRPIHNTHPAATQFGEDLVAPTDDLVRNDVRGTTRVNHSRASNCYGTIWLLAADIDTVADFLRQV
jgi:hypothetical protein